MHLRTLGYQTELLFHRFDAHAHDAGDHLVIRTPQNPGYYWGNLLLFSEAPQTGDFSRWIALFQQAFHDLPEVRHMTFAWDDPQGPAGEDAPFRQAGFEADAAVVLTATDLAPLLHPHPDLQVRALTVDDEWHSALAMMEACHPGESDTLRKQMHRYRRMADGALGEWYGGFIKGVMAGCLGVFQSDAWARFQQVHTHPDYRGQGVCATLVHRVAREWLARPPVAQLVMVAEPNSQAQRIYQRVGFQPVERLGGLVKAPSSKR